MRSAQVTAQREARETFACFGGECAVLVEGSGPAGTAREAAARAKRRLLAWHAQFSRFDPGSELSQMNADPRRTVPVSATMARFAQAAIDAAERTSGIVDPTLVAEIEHAGYADDFATASVPLADALRLAPPRTPAGAHRACRWREVSVDQAACTVTRPPGIRLDSGGIVKGLLGDLLAPLFSRHATFAIDAAGDVRFGGTAHLVRPVRVASPFDGSILHVFELPRGAVATSGIGRRSWIDQDGRPAHHLLDPATGRPAFTGIVQVTAIAPAGVEAEVLAKAALLSGPDRAERWLPHGGLVVYEDGTAEVFE